MCENFLKYWNFNVKTWYIFLRISVLGGIYYEAGKLQFGAIGQKVCVKTDITVDISIVMSV